VPAPIRAFTLIELLLVMALLAIVLAVAMPSLSGFFRGRSLDYEARRLLALARHAQSRAVSEGIPMMLWIDEHEKRYGVEQEPGWDDRDAKAIEFKIDPELEVEVVVTNTPATLLPKLQLSTTELTEAQKRNLPEIRFLPDGSVEEGSPAEVRLTGKTGAGVMLVQSTNRLTYELRPAEQ
jgi:type II secretion system protein H